MAGGCGGASARHGAELTTCVQHCVPKLLSGTWSLLVAGTGFEPVKLARRIYSPLPLAARATCRLAGYNERVDRSQTASTDRKGRSHGGLIIRHRQQGRPARG